MNRRQFLGVAATAGITACAGCASLGEPTVLPALIESSEGDHEQHLLFGPTADRVGIVTLASRGDVLGGTGTLEVVIWHRPGTVVDEVVFALRAPAEAFTVPATVHLAATGDAVGADISVSTSGDDAPIFTLRNLRDGGEDNVSFEVILRPAGEAPSLAAVDVRVSLRDDRPFGQRYLLSGGTLLRPIDA